jgi:hypothetical protein
VHVVLADSILSQTNCAASRNFEVLKFVKTDVVLTLPLKCDATKIADRRSRQLVVHVLTVEEENVCRIHPELSVTM